MANLDRDEVRNIIAGEVERYLDTPGGAPPPQLVEAMVDLESGFQYDLNDHGAIGLGQITEAGAEWSWFKADPANQARFGELTTDRLYDPQFNLAVMVYGLDKRQQQGGALTDWFMASASYLGGADKSGFNDNRDRIYGTSGQEYVLGVQERIADQWGNNYVTGIDKLQPGAAVNVSNVFEAYYDPNVQYSTTGVPRGNTFIDQRNSPAPEDTIYDLEEFSQGGYTLGEQVVTDIAGAGWVGGIVKAVGAWLPRIGLFLLGLVAIVGAVMLARR